MANAALSETSQQRVIRKLAGSRAERFQREVLLPRLAYLALAGGRSRADVLDALESPYRSMRAILGYYAFCRRGLAGEEYATMAVAALDRVTGDDASYAEFLSVPDPPSLWPAVAEECERRGKKPSEQPNRALVDGFLELAHSLYWDDGVGNVFHAVRDGLIRSGHVQPLFETLTGIRGVGPKIASLLLRDTVWLYSLERLVAPGERLLLQPVDAWLRRVADLITDEVSSQTTADWVIAGKVSKFARRAGVSGVEFNMGVQFFGMREVRHIHILPRAFARLANEPG